MADTDIIVSQMPNASQVGNSDLVMLTQPNAQAETGYSTAKTTVGAVATKVGNGIEFVTDLSRFNDKTLTGAINENKDSILALLPVDEVSGAVANFDTEFALPLIDVKADIKAVETGTGAKSPSNPYVISGFTGMNLRQAKKNLFAGYGERTYIHPNVNYYLSSGNIADGKRIRFLFYDKNDNQITPVRTSGTTALYVNASGYLVLSNDATYLHFVVGVTNSDVSYCIAIDDRETAFHYPNFPDIQFEVNSAATEYEAYQEPSVFPVSWQTEAGEVFGGYYDFTTGKLVATHQIGSLALSSVGWHEDANRAGVFYCGVPVAYGRKNASNVLACSCFNATNTSPNTTNDLYISGMASYSGTSVFFRNSEWTGKTSAEINTLLANETFVYELATPVEYDLTPQQISALLGVNNIWNDTNGDTIVKYKLGIQKYIDKKIAEVQALVL